MRNSGAVAPVCARRRSLGVAAVPAALAGSTVTAADASSSNGLWFVELQSPPAVKGTSVENKAEKQAFRDEAADAGVSLRERDAFDRSGTDSRSRSTRPSCRR